METRPGKVPSGGFSFLAEGGIGAAAWWKGPVTCMPYILAQVRIRSAQANRWRPSPGPQLRFGSRLSFGENQSLLGEYRGFYPLLYSMGRENDLSLEYRFSLGRDSDLRLNILFMEKVGQVSLTWNHFF